MSLIEYKIAGISSLLRAHQIEITALLGCRERIAQSGCESYLKTLCHNVCQIKKQGVVWVDFPLFSSVFTDTDFILHASVI